MKFGRVFTRTCVKSDYFFLWEQHRLNVFRNRALKSIFGPREQTLKWAGGSYTVRTFVCMCIYVYIYLFIYLCDASRCFACIPCRHRYWEFRVCKIANLIIVVVILRIQFGTKCSPFGMCKYELGHIQSITL